MVTCDCGRVESFLVLPPPISLLPPPHPSPPVSIAMTRHPAVQTDCLYVLLVLSDCQIPLALLKCPQDLYRK